MNAKRRRGTSPRRSSSSITVPIWSVPVEWPDETVFIIGGGPSVNTQPIEKIAGRKIIVVNSSYTKFLDAPYLYTMDNRWLKYHKAVLRASFKGKVVTNSQDARMHHNEWPELLFLNRVHPPGLSTDRTYTTGLRTSLHGAINLACHLTNWTGKIVLLGADGGRDPAGNTHHHIDHPWRVKPSCWDEQLTDLKTILPVLKEKKIPIVNASPGTRWPIFPITDLETVLALERPAPFIVAGADIKKISELITKDCDRNFRLKNFLAICRDADLIHALPFLGRGVVWTTVGYSEGTVLEKLRSLFGTEKTKEDFVRIVRNAIASDRT